MNFIRNRLALGALAFGLALSGNAMMSGHSWAQMSPPLTPLKFNDSCTQANKDVLLVAHENLRLMLDDALEGVSKEFDSQEYRDAFGEPNTEREFDVLGRLLLMRIGVSTVDITVNCIAKGVDKLCDKGVWAYVPKQAEAYEDKKYIINFCHSYLDTTDEFVQKVSMWPKASMMQGAVFLHEVTHFAWNSKEMLQEVGLNPGDDAHPLLGTTDKRYNAKAVKRLAEKNPDRAVKNADSYHVFVMKLAMRKGTIYK